MDLIKKIGFKPEKIGLIFDPAHGRNVIGKSSPDGKHKEYRWSRNTIECITDKLESVKQKTWGLGSPLLSNQNEIGISKRVDIYNEVAQDYDLLIMLSLHNDAFKNPPAWWDGPGGFTLFTSRGETEADPICGHLGTSLKKYLPEERFRFDYGLSRGETMKDLDREANFGVIYGYKDKHGKLVRAKYAGILIENNFMDIKADYEKLLNDNWNNNLQYAYVYSILSLMTSLGKENFVEPISIKNENKG